MVFVTPLYLVEEELVEIAAGAEQFHYPVEARTGDFDGAVRATAPSTLPSAGNAVRGSFGASY